MLRINGNTNNRAFFRTFARSWRQSISWQKMLLEIIEHVRTRVIKPPSDAVDVLGKLAVYLQLLPDIIRFAAKIKP